MALVIQLTREPHFDSLCASMATFTAVFSPAFRMRLRRFRPIHMPLAWLNRVVFPSIWAAFLNLGRRFVPSSFWFAPPIGYFSDLEALSTEAALPGKGRIILQDQGNPFLPEPSIMLLCKRTQHQQQPWPVFWRYHHNVRLIGTSLIHSQNRKLSLEAVYGEPRLKSDPAWLSWPTQPPVVLEGAWTSVVSRWLPNRGKSPYAHWLLDALPRLALLDEFPSGTRVLVPQDMYKSQDESLALLGLSERVRRSPEKHLLVEHFYFSAPPSMIVSYSPYAVETVRRMFLPRVNRNPATPRRFFIRRTSVGRNMINESEVLEFFEKLGWQIIDTAALGFAEQIQWFAGAEAICAIHGSGTANMVWCSPFCKFIEMFAADYLAGDQEWIAQCLQVEYHFMIFPCDYKLDAQIDLNVLQTKLRGIGLL